MTWLYGRIIQSTRIGTYRVVDLVKLEVEYLTRQAMQAPDGRFFHSPRYKVSFNVECARMTLGLQLAGPILRANGDVVDAQLAKAGAARGLSALRRGVREHLLTAIVGKNA